MEKNKIEQIIVMLREHAKENAKKFSNSKCPMELERYYGATCAFLKAVDMIEKDL